MWVQELGPRKGSMNSTRISVSLTCSECKTRNYPITKRREQKVEIKKFCKTCVKHTLHRDAK